ncbi:non-canonical purine NTP phosphatase [Pseudoalteromonas rubra]|uniref:Inosine/xanthosine triphosphatase n=1 Tax=Pseudoalteromonas rubra TaxID=43658 RepID=A0A5S3WT90_9GAMM|nr:inosine/xanthosine triphosphatase [Pseudoalteromonas rubra]TMP31543.1 non-canonical purine NTP phosphatase [Pseudoalteromonas rubra]TMP34627.1 non-canonical purine NTP phosphatase [Pseudoalteromonas rubra]
MAVIKVLVGSKNPVKINAARQIFMQYYPDHDIQCEGLHAPSGVADQPLGEPDTLLGAQNRVHHLVDHHTADYYCAMEGGAHQFAYGPATFAFVVISDGLKESVGRSANLPLPQRIYDALLGGEELGHVMDRMFDTDNIKQKGGAIGLLTNHLATRESAYTQALLLAMAPFNHAELYS